MNTKPTTDFFLETRKKPINFTYGIKLRVTYNRDRRYFSINKLRATIEDFEKIQNNQIKNAKALKIVKEEMDNYKQLADNFIKDCDTFSFQIFKDNFINHKQKKDTDVYTVFQAYIDELAAEGRLSTRDSYKYALKALKSFYGNKKLLFELIDHRFLKRFEAHLQKEGYSITSIGIWMRSFRTIVNIGIKYGYLKIYPFGKGGYQIANPPARKMALTTEELKKLFEYQPNETHSEAFYFNLWKFAYLCSGINVKDLLHLKYSNIERDKIYYLREKTKRTNLRGKEIAIPISDEISFIIETYGQKKVTPNTYIFNILKPGMSDSEIKAQTTQTTKQINKYVRRVAESLKIEVNISTYTARHSYATQLMRHGAPTEFISKQLGHSNVKTTSDYLENFEDRQLNEWQKKVTDFNL